MNYYAKGGQAYGLKSLAQELPKYGRYGDDMVAHISSDEARMLQAMGGSGTINPETGLPEFFLKKAVKAVAKPFQQAAKAVTGGVKAVQNLPGIKQVSDVATQAFKPIDQALVGLDKTVGKAIPGGWGTVASVAGSAMGLPTPYLTGLGALTGSGVMRKGGSFNLQGALIGGATAYASAKLGDYARAAAPGAGEAVGPQLLAGGDDALAAMGGASGAAVIPESAVPQLLNAVPPPPPSITSQIMSGNFGNALSQAGTNISDAASRAYTSAGEGLKSLGTSTSDAFKTAVNPSTYANAIDSATTNLSQTGAGIKNLVTGPAGVSKAAGALSGVNPVNMGGMALFGATSLSDLDAQRDFLRDQQAAGNIAQAEYDAAMAEINRSEAIARETVARNPFNTNPDRSASIGDTYYDRFDATDTLYGRNDPNARMYAKGGEVPGYFMGGALNKMRPAIENIIAGVKNNISPSSSGGLAAGSPVGFQNLKSEGMPSMPAQGIGSIANSLSNALLGTSSPSSRTPINLGITLYDKRDNAYDELMGKNYAVGGSIDDSYGMDEARGLYQGNMTNGFMNMGSTPAFAEGGQPRFLSGGGDGMSDSIKASINGTQEARLADGEFVIPADVVSHLGNGSSKAGAKQLYSMMDKVRKARTGNPKQGKQINPRKFLAA
jgi:hypothetical protein